MFKNRLFNGAHSILDIKLPRQQLLLFSSISMTNKLTESLAISFLHSFIERSHFRSFNQSENNWYGKRVLCLMTKLWDGLSEANRLGSSSTCNSVPVSLLCLQFIVILVWKKNQLKLQKKLSVKGVQQKYPISTLGKIACKYLSRVCSLKRSLLYSLAKSSCNLRKSVVVVNITFQFPSKKSLNSGSAQAQIISLKQFIIIIVVFVISAINLQGHVFSCARKKAFRQTLKLHCYSICEQIQLYSKTWTNS